MGSLNYEEENQDKCRMGNLKEVFDAPSSNIQDEMRLALLRVAGNYTLDNARYLTKQLNDYLNKLPKGNESNEEIFKLALEKFFSVHFFCCEVAKVTKQYVLDYNLKVALSTLISIRLFSAQGLSPRDEAYKAIKRQIKSIMFTVYIRYFCYLTGKFSCVGVAELVSQFVRQELSSSVSNFVKEIEEEFSKNPPPSPEYSKLFHFSNYPIIDLAKVEVIDISDNSDNEEVWHRFEKLKVENEVKRREAKKRSITKTKLKVGSVICISDDDEMPSQSAENSRQNGVERAAKVITEASGLLSKFMDMNSSSKLTLKISKEELSLHIDPGSPERRNFSDEDLQRSCLPTPQYPHNSSLALRGEAPLWTSNAPPYVLSSADGRCYYAPYNPAEFPRVPLEPNNANRLTLNPLATNQNLDRTSMTSQENRFYLWPSQHCVKGRSFEPSGIFPQEHQYYEEYRENNNLPTPIIKPQLEGAVVKTESIDVANSPEAIIGEEASPEASAGELIQLEHQGTPIITAEITSAIESSEFENNPKYAEEARVCGNLLLSQDITDIIPSSMSSTDYKLAITDSDENLNLNENRSSVFERPPLTYTPEQLMLMKEDGTRKRDDPMKYIIAVKNSIESDGGEDDGLLNLSSTGEVSGECIKSAFSEFKAGKPQSDSFTDKLYLFRQRDTSPHPLKPTRVPDSYLQDPRVSLLQYEATSDFLRLESTDSSDSEIVLKIDDCGISSPENFGHVETKANPSLVHCTTHKTIKPLKTKAEEKEEVVKVPSDESEDDLPLQCRLIKYQHLNQGKSTPVTPLKRSKKGRLTQREGKKAGKKKRHHNDATRFYTLKLRSFSKSSSKNEEVRTAFRPRGRPRKKSSRVQGKSSKVSKSAKDKPKKSANLPLIEETPIKPSFSLEETYSLATTPPKKMFLFSFLRKNHKTLDDTTHRFLEQQTIHTENMDSDAREAEKSPNNTESMESSDLKKTVENIMSDVMYTNNANQQDTIYVNIPTTIPVNNTIVTAQRKLFNENTIVSKSEQVTFDASMAIAATYDESSAANISQERIVIQEGLENTTSLRGPKNRDMLVESSAASIKQQQIPMVNYVNDFNIQSSTLAGEQSSENFEEVGTSKKEIHNISDMILHSNKSKSAESIRKKQTNEEKSVEREVAEKSILEENLKLKKVSTERRPEEVSRAALNPKLKIHVIPDQIETVFKTEKNTVDACEDHMELEPSETSESFTENRSDYLIMSDSESGSGFSKEEPVDVLEKLIETTKKVTLEENPNQKNNKKVYFENAQETSEELVIRQTKTTNISNKSKEGVKKSNNRMNEDSTKLSEATHGNLTEHVAPQQRKNRGTYEQTQVSDNKINKSVKMTIEDNFRPSDEVYQRSVCLKKPQKESEAASQDLVTYQMEHRNMSSHIHKLNKEVEISDKVTIEGSFEPSEEPPENHVKLKKTQELSEIVSEDVATQQTLKRIMLNRIEKSNIEVEMLKQIILKENNFENSFQPSNEANQRNIELEESLKALEDESGAKEVTHLIETITNYSFEPFKGANDSHVAHNEPHTAATSIENDQIAEVPESHWKLSEGVGNTLVQSEKCMRVSKDVKITSEEMVIGNSLMASIVGLEKTDDAPGRQQFVECAQNSEKLTEKPVELPSYGKIHIISDRILRGSMAKITENLQETNKSENALNVELLSRKISENAGAVSKEPEKKIIIISDWTLRGAKTKSPEFSQKSKEPESSILQVEKAPSKPIKVPETRNWREEREKSFDAIAARALQKTKSRIQMINNAEIALRKEEEIREVKATEEIGKASTSSENSSSKPTPLPLFQTMPELAKTGKLDYMEVRQDELKNPDVDGKTENGPIQVVDGHHLRRISEDGMRLNSPQPELKQLSRNLKKFADDSASRQAKKETETSAISEKFNRNLRENRTETSQNLLKEKRRNKEFLLSSTEMKNQLKSPRKKIEDAILNVKHQIELKQDGNAHKQAIEDRLFRIDNETPKPLVPTLNSEVLIAADGRKRVTKNNSCTETFQIDFHKMAMKPPPRMMEFDTYLGTHRRRRSNEERKTNGAKLSADLPIEFMQFQRDSSGFVSSDKLKQIYKLEEGINAGNEFTFRLKSRDVKGPSSSETVKSSPRGEDQRERAERKDESSKIRRLSLNERVSKTFKLLESERWNRDKSDSKDLKCCEPDVYAKRCKNGEKADKTFQRSPQKDQREENRKFGKVYGRNIREQRTCKEANDSNKGFTENRSVKDQKVGAEKREESSEKDAKNTILPSEPSRVTEHEHKDDKIKENTSHSQEFFQKSDLDIIDSQGPFTLINHEGIVHVKPSMNKRPLTKAALKDMSQIPERIDVKAEEILLAKTQLKAVSKLETVRKMKDSFGMRLATKAALKEVSAKPKKTKSKANEVDAEEVSGEEMSLVPINERDRKPPHAAKIDMRTLKKVKTVSQREEPLGDLLEVKASSGDLKRDETGQLPEDTSSNWKTCRCEESLNESRIDVMLDVGQNIKLKQQLILETNFTVVDSIIAQKDLRNSQELSVPLLQAVGERKISENIQDAFSFLENVSKSAPEVQSVPHELLPSALLLETALESSQCLETDHSAKGVELQSSEQQTHQLSASDVTLGPLINLESNSREFYVMDKDRSTSQVNRKRKLPEQYACDQIKKSLLTDKPDELKQVDMISTEGIAAFGGLEDDFLSGQEKSCHTLVVGDCLESQHKFFSAEHEYYPAITDTVETTPILNFNFDRVEDADSVVTTLSQAESDTGAFPSSFQVFGQGTTQEHTQIDGSKDGDSEEKWVVRYYCPEDVGQIWSEYLQGEDQNKIEIDQYETMDKMIGESQPREVVLEAPDINMEADALGDANWTFLDNYMEELVIEDQVSVPFDIDDKPAMQQQTPDKKHFANSEISGFPEPVGAHQPFPMHDVYFDAELQHAVGIGLLSNFPDNPNQSKKSVEIPTLKSAKEDFVSSLNFNIAAINNIMEFSQSSAFPDLSFGDTQLLLNTSPETPVEMRKMSEEKTADTLSSDPPPKPSKIAKTEPKSVRSKSPKKPQHIVSFLRTSRKTGHCPAIPKTGVDSTPDLSMRDLIIGSREAFENTRVHRSMNHYEPVFPVRVINEERAGELPLRGAKGKKAAHSPKNGQQSSAQPILFDEPSLGLKTRSSMRQYSKKFAGDRLSAIKTGNKTSNPVKLRQSKKNIKHTDIDPFDLLKSSPNMNPSFEQQQAKRRRAANNERSSQMLDAKQLSRSRVSWSSDRRSQSQAKPKVII